MREIQELEMETQKHEEAYVDNMSTLAHESEVCGGAAQAP
jgi:hypothetical protein